TGRRADAALEAVADHPGAAADVALGDRAPACRVERGEDVLRRHMLALDVVEPAVVRLADGRHRPVRALARGARLVRHDRVPHDADAVGVRDRDRRREQPALADPLEPRELAVAVERERAGERGLLAHAASARLDHGDAGPDAVALDQRRVADPYADDV